MELYVKSVAGDFAPADDSALIAAGKAAAARKIVVGEEYDRETFMAALPAMLGAERIERFMVAYMDARMRLLAFELASSGSVVSAPVYPREILRRAMELDAINVVLVHNHPTGGVKASDEDKDMLRKLSVVLGLIDCNVVDSMIVGGDKIISMRQQIEEESGKVKKLIKMLDTVKRAIDQATEEEHNGHAEDYKLPEGTKLN